MFMHKKFCRHFGLRPYFKCPTTSIKGHRGGKKGKALVNDEGHGAIALDLLAHINRRYRDFLGVLGGYLVDGEGHGAIALDFLAHINRR